MSIYGVRSNDPGRANTKIEYKGFEISIAMDDGHRGRDLRRTSIIVYKDDRDMTSELGLEKVTVHGIVDPSGEDLFKIMEAIDKFESTPKVTDVTDRAEHNAFKA